MQAFEESATGAGTTVIKVRIPSQERALGKVAQGDVREERVKVAVGGGAELVQVELGGGKSERWLVLEYHSLCLFTIFFLRNRGFQFG
jgi:hypothetical protein